MSAASIVIAAVGPSLAFAINAVSFLPVIMVLRCFANGPGRRRRSRWTLPRAGIREGVGFVTAHSTPRQHDPPRLRPRRFRRNYQVTMALMVERVFHLGAAGYATASTSFAVGAPPAPSSPAHLRRQRHHGPGRRSRRRLRAAERGDGSGMLVFVAVIVVTAAARRRARHRGLEPGPRSRRPTRFGVGVLVLLATASGGAGVIGGPTLGRLGEHLGPVGHSWSVAACASPRAPFRPGVSCPTTPARSRCALRRVDARCSEPRPT